MMTGKPGPQKPKESKKQTAAQKAAEAKALEEKNEIITETVLGELMHVLIEAPQKMQMGWKSMSQAQQKNIIFEAEALAKDKIKRIVELVTSTDHMTLRVQIDKATIKDNDVQGTISFHKADPNREQFIDFIGSAGVLTLIDPAIFFGDEGHPEAEPDQPDLLKDDKPLNSIT